MKKILRKLVGGSGGGESERLLPRREFAEQWVQALRQLGEERPVHVDVDEEKVVLSIHAGSEYVGIDADGVYQTYSEDPDQKDRLLFEIAEFVIVRANEAEVEQQEAVIAQEWADALLATGLEVSVDLSEPSRPVVESGGRKFPWHLRKLLDRCLKQPEERAPLVAAVAREFADQLKRDADAPPSLHRIVPRVLGLDDFYASPIESGHKLSDDLVVVFVEDLGESMAYLGNAELERLGLEQRDLLHRSIENLRVIAPVKEIVDLDGCWMPTSGGDYESSLILDDELMSELESKAGSPLSFALLQRDVLVVVGRDDTRGLAAIGKVFARFREDGVLSNKLYSYQDERIEAVGELDEVYRRYVEAS